MTSWRLGRSPSGDVGQLAPVPLFSTRAEATEFETIKNRLKNNRKIVARRKQPRLMIASSS
jgi:hypothetical protein